MVNDHELTAIGLMLSMFLRGCLVPPGLFIPLFRRLSLLRSGARSLAGGALLSPNQRLTLIMCVHKRFDRTWASHVHFGFPHGCVTICCYNNFLLVYRQIKFQSFVCKLSNVQYVLHVYVFVHVCFCSSTQITITPGISSGVSYCNQTRKNTSRFKYFTYWYGIGVTELGSACLI